MSKLLHALCAPFGPIWRQFTSHWRRALTSFGAGLVVLMLMHLPLVEASIIGEPDREMLATAFKVKADAVVGTGGPAVLLDIDDDTLRAQTYVPVQPGREPTASAPRGMVADLLRFVQSAPLQRGAAAVIVDVDIGAPAPDDPQGTAALRDALQQWSADPRAPQLIIAREAFAPKVLGLEGEHQTLPTTDYDDLVAKAPNIRWGSVKMLADHHGVIHEFLPYQCVEQGGALRPLYSAVLLASGAIAGAPPAGSPSARALAEAPEHCASDRHDHNEHGQVINFQLSLDPHREEPDWASVDPNWLGFKTCGAGSDTSVFRRLSAADVLAAGPDAARDFLCRRLVIIGGTNQVANDFQQTPLHMMPGPLILVNAVRGVEGSGGGLRQAGLVAQITALFCISLLISFGFAVSRAAHEHYHHQKAKARHWSHHVALFPLNPVVLNLLVGLMAHWIGVGVLLVTLKYGYWGFLSAPAFGSAVAETIQEFSE